MPTVNVNVRQVDGTVLQNPPYGSANHHAKIIKIRRWLSG
jgi:predicted RNA methylase